MNDRTSEGGCFCGAIRFRISGRPLSVTNCHCRDCQRVSGAAFQTWVTIHPGQFKVVRGKPARYRYGRTRVRAFCARCGSPLTFIARDTPDEIDVTVCSLDNPAAFRPQDHIWVCDRLSWIKLADGLPSFKKAATRR